jgi:hypothetical protein
VGETVIRAIRAYSCISESGDWVEPPARVVFTTEKTVFPATTTKRALQACAEQANPAASDVTASTDVPAATDPALLANALRKMRASGKNSIANGAAPSPGRSRGASSPVPNPPATTVQHQRAANPGTMGSDPEPLSAILAKTSKVDVKLIYVPAIKNQAKELKT